MYTKYDLLETVNRELAAEFGDSAKISLRTIEYELNEIETKADFIPNLNIGHQRVYRYEDPSFSYKGDDESLTDEELETLDRAIDVLREADYGDKPQFAYVRACLELIKTENTDTSNISFQSNIDLKGLEFFEELMSATINRQTLNVTYQPYEKDEREVQLSPYLLKQYNDRWFLIGKERMYDGLTTLAIDRIHGVSRARYKFQPSDVDLEELYENIVGVTLTEGMQVEDIKLRVNAKRYPYIATKPIHLSQREIKEECNEKTKVIMLQLVINKELVSTLLSFGDDIEVVSPASLRDIMKEYSERMYKNYKTLQ